MGARAVCPGCAGLVAALVACEHVEVAVRPGVVGGNALQDDVPVDEQPGQLGRQPRTWAGREWGAIAYLWAPSTRKTLVSSVISWVTWHEKETDIEAILRRLLPAEMGTTTAGQQAPVTSFVSRLRPCRPWLQKASTLSCRHTGGGVAWGTGCCEHPLTPGP